MGDVDELSGRALDAAVAEEVVGRVVVVAPVGDGMTRTRDVWGETMDEACTALREAYADHEGLRDPYFDGPNYSTLISAAWEVLEALRERGFYLGVHDNRHGCYRFRGEPNQWWVEVTYHEAGDDLPSHDPDWDISADTAPLAICRAALKAVRSEKHEPV